MATRSGARTQARRMHTSAAQRAARASAGAWPPGAAHAHRRGTHTQARPSVQRAPAKAHGHQEQCLGSRRGGHPA
eukprot:7017034-Alexandrium_andersonii.AAC.1